MLRIKCFISAGCSFSQVPSNDVTWPVHVRDALYPECVYYLGQGAAGNGVISRKLIYTVQKALEIYKPEEILVGVMWSGHDRMSFYYDPDSITTKYNKIDGSDNYCNPVRVAEDYNHYLVNFHWRDDLTRTYLRYFHNDVSSHIWSLEHILRTQWFLTSAQIPYFMSEYSYDCLPRSPELLDNPEIKYLYEMIDKDKWLPIDNMWKYAIDSGIPFPRENDNHPGTQQHEKFVYEIVLPWLHGKYLHKYFRP